VVKQQAGNNPIIVLSDKNSIYVIAAAIFFCEYKPEGFSQYFFSQG